MPGWVWLADAWVRSAVGAIDYWVRPYDMLADARRWRWQPRTPCGRYVLTDAEREQLAEWWSRVLPDRRG